jgi:hypothetical protein
VTGLSNTTAYTFTVMAINAAGNGTASMPSSFVTNISILSKELNAHMTGSSMILKLPEFTGTARILVMDIQGRIVLNRIIDAGSNEVALPRGSSSSLYIVRLVRQGTTSQNQIIAQSEILLAQ